uniref:Uncharacterized protein n=1 Tax=Opuntia streptacantha TaxID=393608 RepID=A0A7C8YB04_OPUST
MVETLALPLLMWLTMWIVYFDFFPPEKMWIAFIFGVYCLPWDAHCAYIYAIFFVPKQIARRTKIPVSCKTPNIYDCLMLLSIFLDRTVRLLLSGKLEDIVLYFDLLNPLWGSLFLVIMTCERL